MSKSGNLAALTAIFQPGPAPHVFYAEDPPYLPRILVFYWPVHAVGSLTTTARIRTTILSAAGFKNFAAFSVSPSSAYYSAVHKLPEDKQRDETYRGLAFSLCRYFAEVPTEVKNAITEENPHQGTGLKWGQAQAAHITCRLGKVVNVEEVIEALRPFLKERPSSPVAPIRPLNSIRKTRPSFLPPEVNQGHLRYGQLATPGRRIPSSHSRRTPSTSTPGPKPTPHKLSEKPTAGQLESLRFKMCEFVDTEDRYIARLQQLIDLVTTESRTPKSLSSKFASTRGQKTVNAMLQFPSLLDQIRDLNIAFLDDLESALQNTEDSAMSWLEKGQNGSPPSNSSSNKDVIGVVAFAKVLLNHFPKFPVPYRTYLDLHSSISSNLDSYLKESATSVQQAPSLLMEPAQRISRYGLYIDTMIPLVPSTSTIALRTLEKARKIIAEICEMEPAASTILDGLRIEHENKRRGALSPTKFLSSLTRGGLGSGTIREAPPLTTPKPRDKDCRETPRLLPSISRSLSRRVKSRPLTEQDVDQVNNISSQHYQNNENSRPFSSHSGSSSLSRRRPNTAGSSASAGSVVIKPSYTPVTTYFPPVNENGREDEYMIKAEKLEQENYRLLAENAQLKQRLRLCRCQAPTQPLAQ